MTLYDQLSRIENMNLFLNGLGSRINVEDIQKKVFQQYESNPVLHDALLGKQTITQSLEELAEINKGVKRFLPHRKNKIHNERVEQMGELVPGVYNLTTRGILYPDNFVTTCLETVALSFGTVFLVSSLTGGLISETGERFEGIMAAGMSPIGILIGLVMNRSGNLPVGETVYLDKKVKEIYGAISK